MCTEEMKEEDEDYLFEFDLDSHDSWETEDEEEGEHAVGEQENDEGNQVGVGQK